MPSDPATLTLSLQAFYNNVRPHGSLEGRPPVTRIAGLG